MDELVTALSVGDVSSVHSADGRDGTVISADVSNLLVVAFVEQRVMFFQPSVCLEIERSWPSVVLEA